MVKLDKSKLVTNLGKKYHLVPYLEKAFNDFDEAWEYKYEEKQGDTAWHPSGHCTPTVSELYAITQGADSFGPISGSLRKSFQVGHFWHQLLQYIILHKLEFCEPEAIERRGTRVWGEVEEGSRVLTKEELFQPFHWATGAGDVAPIEVPKWKGIVDFKTMSSHQYKQAGIPDWAAAKYECQINIYMDIFDEEKAIIVPINKDSPHDMKEFEFVRNQDLIDAIYDKWKYVSQAIEEDEVITTMDDELWEDLPLTGPVSS